MASSLMMSMGTASKGVKPKILPKKVTSPCNAALTFLGIRKPIYSAFVCNQRVS